MEDLVVDRGARRVRRGEHDIELPRLSFDLLVALIEAAPDALSTDELMDRVWKGVVVSASTVAKRVELLRQALDDQSDEPRYVALVRGYGYRLVPTPEPASPPGPPSRRPEPAPRGRASTWLGALAVLALAVGAWWWFDGRDAPPASMPPERTVAVLPFSALGDNAEDQRFAAGLTEEVSSSLARSGQLLVSGRTSAELALALGPDPRAAGQSLGVAHVLNGTVRREAGRLSVVARLVDTDSGFQRWSGSFDEPIEDTLALQRRLADRVAEALRVSLSAPERPRQLPVSADPRAYARYLEARGLVPFPRSPEPQRAIELLEEALDLDPDFAEAWSLLAVVHAQRLFFRDPSYALSAAESLAVIRDATEHALAADPNSGLAYGVLGGVAWLFEGDDAKAAALYEQAVRFAPWETPMLRAVGEFARAVGRLGLAQQIFEYVVQRDPLCVICRVNLARTQMLRRDYPAALDNYKVAAAANPYHASTLADLYVLMGDYDKAAATLETLGPGLSSQQARLAHARGEAEGAEQFWNELVNAERTPYTWLAVSRTAAWLGKIDEAFEALEAATPHMRVEQQRFYLDPFYDPLRKDPRWAVFLERIGRAPAQLDAVDFSLDGLLDLPPAPGPVVSP